MNRYMIFTLAILVSLGLTSAQFTGLDFFNIGLSEGETLTPAKEAVQVAPDKAVDVGVLNTEKPVFGIIRGEIETHKIGGYVVQEDATVVAVPAGKTYQSGMGSYLGTFAILSSGVAGSYSLTTEYAINSSGIPYGPEDYRAYKATPVYNPTTDKTEFLLAYNVTSGTETVDLYLDRGTSLDGIMKEVEVELTTVELESESEIPAGFEALFVELLSQAEPSTGTE